MIAREELVKIAVEAYEQGADGGGGHETPLELLNHTRICIMDRCQELGLKALSVEIILAIGAAQERLGFVNSPDIGDTMEWQEEAMANVR